MGSMAIPPRRCCGRSSPPAARGIAAPIGGLRIGLAQVAGAAAGQAVGWCVGSGAGNMTLILDLAHANPT